MCTNLFEDLRPLGEVYAGRSNDALLVVQEWIAGCFVISTIQNPKLVLELRRICTTANTQLCTFTNEVGVLVHGKVILFCCRCLIGVSSD